MPEHAEHALAAGERPTEVRIHRTGGILTASVPFPVSDWRPERFLRDARHGVRGAWCGHRGWAVHSGALLCLTADAGDRFGRIRDLARRSADLSPPGGASGSPEESAARGAAPRFYGGFAYSAPRTEAWESFGGARFVLPRWELRRVGATTFLLAHALGDGRPGADGPNAGGGEALRRRALDLREELLEGVKGGGERSRGSGPSPREPAPVEERSRWKEHVEDALSAIRAGRLRKVVLARSQELASGLPPLEALSRLRVHLNGPGTFLIQPRGDAAFLGSSPELLADLRGTRFTATAVAGSADRHPDPEADRERARALLQSRKDRREQAIVAEEIQERLSSMATAVRISDPEILTLPDILHLESRVEARLPGRRHVLDLLARIHPTPAVCGRPRPEAQAFLGEHEAMDRGWYAGPMGWFDARGDGSFSPGLRAGLWRRGRWRIFAGAGIVTGSDPEAEWRETQLKLDAIRRGFGLAGS